MPIVIGLRPGPTEELLAGIYARILVCRGWGPEDSFFDLGGDSLSAMRLVAAVNEALGAGLSVRRVFEAPTVAQLAGVSGVRVPPGWRRVRPVARPAVVPLSFAQQRLWFLEQLQGPSPVYNMGVALRLCGRLDAAALGAALSDVVARHESLRTVFPAVEGTPRQVVVPVERAEFGWQVVDASGWSPASLGQAVEAAVRYSFDFGGRDSVAGTAFPGCRG
ncbi:condensation domain-containing protein [Mycobacterium xenopi]|uniref:condensation domain-containing protein n=1 Tax=Mycobacterium xenopi TaxID=1789 RepID=UPI000D993B48|nr:condensation domain-containing protein [Mycobacterium xenopi]SPX79650.1 linear gramicidin synthetase subunit D [Mycobacterium xenopi]